MSESKRWWSLSKVLSSLQIWRESRNPLNVSSTLVPPVSQCSRGQSAESSNDSKKSDTSEYEDMEEFIERQREARMTITGYGDDINPADDFDNECDNSVSDPSSTDNDNRMYTASGSSTDDHAENDELSSTAKLQPDDSLTSEDNNNNANDHFERSTTVNCNQSVKCDDIVNAIASELLSEDGNDNSDPVDRKGIIETTHLNNNNANREDVENDVQIPIIGNSSILLSPSRDNAIKSRHVSRLTITLVPSDYERVIDSDSTIIKTESRTSRSSSVVSSSFDREQLSEDNAETKNAMEYRDHFEEIKSTLDRKKRRRVYAIRRLSANTTVRLDKAWKSLKDWWSEEKYRLGIRKTSIYDYNRNDNRVNCNVNEINRNDNEINCNDNEVNKNDIIRKVEDCDDYDNRVVDNCNESTSEEVVCSPIIVELRKSSTLSTAVENKRSIDERKDERIDDNVIDLIDHRRRENSLGRLSIASLADYRRKFYYRSPSSIVRNRPRSCYSDISDVTNDGNRFPRRNPPHPPPSRTSGISAFRRSRNIDRQGQEGFEELRRYIKQGGDFCKELSVILQERSEAEIHYAKTLSKLSSKLLKSSKDTSIGTVTQAWHKAILEMESIAEIHRAFATALAEEVVKPLKQLLESQHRIRKSVETAVDKTSKSLSEWRAAESKSKKQSFVSARENEKLQDMMLDIRLNGTTALATTNKLTASTLHLHHQRPSSEKECNKLETKRRKAEEMVKKSDVEYYTYCIRAERARLEWETAVMRGSQCFQALEEERLERLKHLGYSYWQHCQDIGPKLIQSSLRLKEPLEACDVNADIKTISTLKGIEQPVSEQLLPDFYAEHMTLAMNRERRRQALVKILQLIVHDLEREKRGKSGVENLARAFKQTPTFGTDDSQQNVTEKLHHMKYMLTYLEAARYKVSNALSEIDAKPKASHPLSSHIHVVRDKQGLQQSILKVPAWVSKDIVDANSMKSVTLDWNDRGTADGNSVQPDSDFDEFSSQSSNSEKEDFEHNAALSVTSDSSSGTTALITKQCKALYHYSANLYDELNLQPGDVINIHDKQPDGWWLGELNGVIGIFPATYVQEIG